MATASNTFAELAGLWVERGFRGRPAFRRKRRTDGELEAFVQAARGVTAGRLSIMTYRGDIYVRLGPPHTLYWVNSQRELVSIVRQLLTERALFVVTYEDEVWTGTTLVTRGLRPKVRRGEVAYVLSWSGRFDERLDATPGRRSNYRVKSAGAPLAK